VNTAAGSRGDTARVNLGYPVRSIGATRTSRHPSRPVSGASPQQAALAWLLQRSATTVLIPGASSPDHLRENVAAARLELPADAIGR